MSLLKINNKTFDEKIIKEYKVSYEKLDGPGTKRNLNGNMRRQVINNKIKISVSTIENASEEVIENLLNEITKDTGVCEYFDPKTRSVKSINCYFSIPETDLYAVIGEKKLYNTLSFRIIEL